MSIKSMKLVVSFAVTGLLCLFFSGCSENKRDYRYSSSVGNWQSSERYIITSLAEDYMVYDKITGEEHTLVTDPFADGSVRYVNVCDDSAYYIEYYGNDGSWRINEIDLETFSTTNIYDRDNSESVFLGLSYKQTNLNSFLSNSVYLCMVTDKYIFLETGLNGLVRVDRVSGIEKNILGDMSYGNFCSDGEKIYYMTNEMRPKSYSILNESETILTDEILVEDMVLMSRGELVMREYDGDLYLCDTSDEGGTIKSLGVKADCFTASSGYIYFTTDEGVYRMKPDEMPVLIYEGDYIVIDAMNDEDYLYFLRQESGKYIKGIINTKDMIEVFSAAGK